MIYNSIHYDNLLTWETQQELPSTMILKDHLGGHKFDLTNAILDRLNNVAGIQGKQIVVRYHSVLDQTVKQHYPNLLIQFDSHLQDLFNLNMFCRYNMHPELDYKNFVCSFNGSPHVSRKLLTSIMQKFGWFNPEYCSKNVQFDLNSIDGHISDWLTADQQQFYNKFFLTSNEFCQQEYSFGHVRFAHRKNIYNLEHKLTQSFLHLVSETMATSYYPFVTEKFLYSVVTRGLFLTYAQPGWHSHLEQYYGFKKYTKLFDYQFDTIQNPVKRLVELMSMISKFSILSPDDWHDLYLLQQDEIEYNYDHYFSGNYLKTLKQHE